jgi:hypothetical protein
LSDTINIQKNERGKVITAELSYSPFGNSGYTYNGRPVKDSKYTGKEVKKMLSNHVDNAQSLRDMSDYLYNTNGIYRRLVDTTKNLVSYEHLISPLILNKSRLNEKTYENKYNKVRQYIWNCNFDATLDDIIFKSIKYGRYSAFDRGTYLQPLPLEYTRIIGVTADGNPILQFNFSYFDEFQNMRERTMQLDGFDTIFKSQYLKFKQGIDNPKENFANELNWRTLPHEKTYTLKIGSNLESKEGIGLLYGSVDDILFYDEIRELDRIVIGSQKRKIIVQKLPVDAEGNSILGEEEIIQAHNNIKSLLPPNVGCLTVLGGTEFDDIPLQLSALEKGKMKEVQEDVLTSSGVGEGALKGGNFSTGVLNIEVITNTIVKILKQIEHVWFNRKFKQLVGNGQYQFKLKFLGMTSFNKDDIIESFDGLLDKGGTLTPSIAARGFEIVEYTDILDIEDALEYKEKFEPLITSYTMSGEGAGRPGSDNGGDNTEKGKKNGANNNPKPSN